jgi:hypothetical protein
MVDTTALHLPPWHLEDLWVPVLVGNTVHSTKSSHPRPAPSLSMKPHCPLPLTRSSVTCFLTSPTLALLVPCPHLPNHQAAQSSSFHSRDPAIFSDGSSGSAPAPIPCGLDSESAFKTVYMTMPCYKSQVPDHFQVSQTPWFGGETSQDLITACASNFFSWLAFRISLYSALRFPVIISLACCLTSALTCLPILSPWLKCLCSHPSKVPGLFISKTYASRPDKTRKPLQTCRLFSDWV